MTSRKKIFLLSGRQEKEGTEKGGSLEDAERSVQHERTNAVFPFRSIMQPWLPSFHLI